MYILNSFPLILVDRIWKDITGVLKGLKIVVWIEEVEGHTDIYQKSCLCINLFHSFYIFNIYLYEAVQVLSEADTEKNIVVWRLQGGEEMCMDGKRGRNGIGHIWQNLNPLNGDLWVLPWATPDSTMVMGLLKRAYLALVQVLQGTPPDPVAEHCQSIALLTEKRQVLSCHTKE